MSAEREKKQTSPAGKENTKEKGEKPEKEKLDKEKLLMHLKALEDLGKKKGELAGLQNKLANPGFVSKAPANVVAAERERAEKLEALIAKLEEQLAGM